MVPSDPTEHVIPPEGHRTGWIEKVVAGTLLTITFIIALTFLIGEGLIHRDRPVPTEIREELETFSPAPLFPEPAARASIEAFFEAPDLASKAAVARDGKRVLPLMEDFHLRRGHAFPTMSRLSKGKAVHLERTPMVMFEVEPYSGSIYPIAAIWDGKRFAVDWESLTAYGTIDWMEFVEQRPDEVQTLRIFISSADESDGLEGMDEKDILFRIEHRDDSESLLAVAGEELAGELARLTKNRKVPVTLEMRWKPLGKTGNKIPLIVRLSSAGWSFIVQSSRSQ